MALIGLKTQPDWVENTNISGEKFESPDEDDEIDFECYEILSHIRFRGQRCGCHN